MWGWLVAGLVGLFSGVSTLISAEGRRSQAEYQAKVASANAVAMDQQADLERRQTEAALQEKDQEAIKQKRAYEQAAGENRSLLAAGSVDLTSGSALDLLEGNANRYADDAGTMAYNKAMTRWTGVRQAQLDDWRADVYRSQASYLRQTAGSFGGSLLTAGLSGVSSGLMSYASFGSAFCPGGHELGSGTQCMVGVQADALESLVGRTLGLKRPGRLGLFAAGGGWKQTAPDRSQGPSSPNGMRRRTDEGERRTGSTMGASSRRDSPPIQPAGVGDKQPSRTLFFLEQILDLDPERPGDGG